MATDRRASSGRLAAAAPLALAGAALGYWFLARPWHVRWGATDEEVRKRLPGEGGFRPPGAIRGTWGFFLEPGGDGSTRLIARARWTWAAGAVGWMSHYLVLEPAHFVMERRMLLGIKARAEGAR